MNLLRERLASQRLVRPLATPAAVVRWLGAVQAQDYPAAKWAVAQRAVGAGDVDVERAVATGAILRTHVLRPTWHFVSPDDIRWMLALTAPRVHAACAYYHRQLGLDGKQFARAEDVMAGALEGGRQLSRVEIARVLARAGVDGGDPRRVNYMLLHAELEAVICSGAGRSYALFDERVPPGRARPRDEALAELAARYVAGHGPATIADFVWWSGLTVADARAALASLAPPPDEPGPHRPRRAFLLPNYDEYIVGYADRGALLDPGAAALERNVLFHHTVVVDGRVVGTWRRSIGRAAVALEAIGFAPFTGTQQRLIEEAAGRYGEFLGRSVEIAFRC